MRGRRVRLLRTQRWPRRGHSHRNHRGPHPAHRRVRVVLQVLLLQTEGAARATGGRDDATRVRDAEVSIPGLKVKSYSSGGFPVAESICSQIWSLRPCGRRERRRERRRPPAMGRKHAFNQKIYI